jgi:hypothetical protein
MHRVDYYIENGVHRSVAAREAGVNQILGILFEPGHPPRQVLVNLSELHSSKTSISASDGRYGPVVQAMQTPLGRSRIPPILLQPLGLRGQPPTISLLQVRLDP